MEAAALVPVIVVESDLSDKTHPKALSLSPLYFSPLSSPPLYLSIFFLRPPFDRLVAQQRFTSAKEVGPPVGAYNDPRSALELLKRPLGSKRGPFGGTAVRFKHQSRKDSTPGGCVRMFKVLAHICLMQDALAYILCLCFE